ncbi:MAG: cytidine deaminase [Pseudomonadota bacterium]
MSRELFEAARDASEKHRATYSNFPVGAAIRTVDGQVFTGANIEVVSYPEGWCAETSAIAHMVMAGADGIVEVAVYAPKKDLITPCGGCRQRLAEFAHGDPILHLTDANGVVESTSLSALFPRGFDAEALKDEI